MEIFKIKPWGPKKLREIFKSIETAINKRAPIPGLGIDADEQPDGVQIHAKSEVGASGEAQVDSSGGGASGTTVDLFGALNGQPAVFHLLQSSPPTSPPP
jgi:hypothetical protein